MSQIQCQRAGQNKTVMHRSQETANKCPYCRRALGKNPMPVKKMGLPSSLTEIPVDVDDVSQTDPIPYSFVMELEPGAETDELALKHFSIDTIDETFWVGDYLGTTEEWTEENTVSAVWADDDDFNDEDFTELLNMAYVKDEHFIEWMKLNGSCGAIPHLFKYRVSSGSSPYQLTMINHNMLY